MTENPHFETLDSWQTAAGRVGYEPREPRETQGHGLERLALFVMDHRMREVAPEQQSLEAHYGAFVFTQSRPGIEGADRALRETSYGSDPRVADVSGHEARVYERGPEPAPDDIDPRMPAVVVWADGECFYLVASETLDADALLEIARSVG